MINSLPRQFLFLFFLVLIQSQVLNNIHLTDLNLNPFPYVIFVLFLPFHIQGWLLLLIAFGLGISVDIFSDTFGLHAASIVAMAFLRPYILKFISLREGYEVGSSIPSANYYGFSWFTKYAFILILVHHLMYYYLDIFEFSEFFLTLLKALLGTLFTLCFVLIIQLFMYKRRQR